ncbi:MAG: hypothetical protein DCF25_00445 [Leptolyngbya foveolarum]|uniref:Glycosyltransferase family 1 protein n=1 Tax=Leptolyngbya foveolarum TaxID=47253 RepID=A0A2W4UR20_9CYAN|nr:MAG: hypothetical protein DCF25_00445 [Leptolyngbya foveolarum]
MTINLNATCRENSRVLIWSLRNIQNFVYNACLYEFEDIIRRTDEADIIAPPAYNPLSRVINKTISVAAQKVKSSALLSVNPYGSAIDLWYEYEIYFVILDFPWYTASINLLKNWRRRCRFAVCYIIETWSTDIPALANFMPFFNQFDLLCVGTFHILPAISQMASCPCMFLAPGIDTLKFYPNLEANNRSIDVCSLGRRSAITHRALLEMAAQKPFFYYHELTSGSVQRLSNHSTHRTMTANLLKNSRYFITNHAKANLPGLITSDSEIGYRFFEGAAAGTVMIGCPPQGEHFKRYFDWPDAVIPIRFDEPNINEIISELDARPNYLKRVQINNVVNSLRKHDWVYRWEQVLQKLGLLPTRAMAVRQTRLKVLASDLESTLPTQNWPSCVYSSRSDRSRTGKE